MCPYVLVFFTFIFHFSLYLFSLSIDCTSETCLATVCKTFCLHRKPGALQCSGGTQNRALERYQLIITCYVLYILSKIYEVFLHFYRVCPHKVSTAAWHRSGFYYTLFFFSLQLSWDCWGSWTSCLSTMPVTASLPEVPQCSLFLDLRFVHLNKIWSLNFLPGNKGL